MLRKDDVADAYYRKLRAMARNAPVAALFLLGLFIGIEAANFTGFSVRHLRRLPDDELVNAAIRYNYPGLYDNVADLKHDYSSFTPEVHYWSDLTGEAGSLFWNKFFGFKQFHVRLPNAVVMVSVDGNALFSRPCRANGWCSPNIAPDRPKLGIVGTVQNGPPGYEASNDFTVRWANGSQGSIFISGHCFAAFSESPKPTLEIVDSKPDVVIRIGDTYGYLLVTIPDIKRSGYGSRSIPENVFKESMQCDPAVRANWPNVGGASRKR